MFTCNSCGLQFPTVEDQKIHMKSDWHRYNLKRRVAQLPAISEAVFNEKVAILTINDEMEEVEAKKDKHITKKELRRREKQALYEKKMQILEIAKQNMLKKQNEGNVEVETKKADSEDTIEESKTDIEIEKPALDDQELSEEQLAEKLMATKIANKVEIPATTCLFCPPKLKKNFETIDDNVEHMFKSHGFYIPEKKYLIDLKGLLEYLAEKIGLGNVCLSCSYQGRNIEAVREHMKTKRHMRLPYEKEDEKLEISQFYDFSSTYDDYEVKAAENVEGDEEDGEWEDVTDEEADSDEDDLPPVEQNALIQDGHELILPSGAVIGHRSMARYYRQNLAPERILSEGQGTVIAAETRHMFNVTERKELAVQKRAWNRAKKREDVNDRRAAKFINNQPHFRDPLLQ